MHSLRIAVFGGSFDPIHQGHLAIAETAQRQFSLDKVIFVPAFAPPNKTGAVLTDARHRLKMVQAAINPFPLFKVSDYELQKLGVSYTVDTLLFFKEKYPNSRFFFIVGADTFKTLPKWKDPAKLLEICEFLVAPRDQTEGHLESKGMHWIQMEKIPVSSTEIRRQLEMRSANAAKQIPHPVLDYIVKNALYLK